MSSVALGALLSVALGALLSVALGALLSVMSCVHDVPFQRRETWN